MINYIYIIQVCKVVIKKNSPHVNHASVLLNIKTNVFSAVLKWPSPINLETS